MGSQTIIHGRITLKGNIGRSQQIIRELKDDSYPMICSEMFSTGATEGYSFYDEPVVAFAATYKAWKMIGTFLFSNLSTCSEI
jgi:hypothetical protein